MEELSLEDLTAQLQAVQEKKAAVRLSERNVVELVNKLKELNLLERSLLHTTNGKEYITQEQLRREIKQALITSGGRISLSDLANTLYIDLTHCERQSAVLVANSNKAILSIQEELITQDYLHSLAIEIQERLETTGMLRIGDLALQYGLSQELLLSVVTEHLGTVLNGELLNSMLYTEAYRDRIKVQLRGALRAATSPTMLSTLLKYILLEEGGIADIIHKIARDLIKASDVKGELRSNGMWIPEVHLKAQKSSVISLYNQTGWTSLSAIRKVASTEEPFIKENLGEHFRLETVVISHSFAETINAEIEESLEKGTWCDIRSVIPMEFTEEDARQLLQHNIVSQQSNCHQITETCLLTISFLEAARQRVKEDSVQMAQDSFVQSRQQKRQEESVHTSEEKGGNEDDDDCANEKGKGKKKGRGKAKGKTKQSSGSAKQSTSEEGSTQHSPTHADLVQRCINWYPDIEEVDNLPEVMAELLLPDAISSFKLTIEELMRTTDKRRQELKEKSLKKFEESIGKFWLYAKGIESVLEGSVGDDTILLLKKHLIKTTGQYSPKAIHQLSETKKSLPGLEALDWLLRYYQLQEPGSDEQIPDAMLPIPVNVRSKLVEEFPEDIRPVALKALQSVKQDDPQVVLESLDDGMAACSIRFPKRDKKAEKAKLAEITTTWKKALSQETTPATALQLILPLVLAQAKGILVNLPGKAMPAMMEWLKPTMNEEEYEVLHALHSGVVKDLIQKSTTADDEQSMREELHELLNKAKTFVQD